MLNISITPKSLLFDAIRPIVNMKLEKNYGKNFLKNTDFLLSI